MLRAFKPSPWSFEYNRLTIYVDVTGVEILHGLRKRDVVRQQRVRDSQSGRGDGGSGTNTVKQEATRARQYSTCGCKVRVVA
jgi:hypothetical protein